MKGFDALRQYERIREMVLTCCDDETDW